MKRVKCVIFVMAVLAIFALRYISALPNFDKTSVGSYIGQELVIRGTIEDKSVQYGLSQQFLVKAGEFRQFGNSYLLRGEISVRASAGYRLEYGDYVELNGRLEKPFRDDLRISAAISNPRISAIGPNRGNAFAKALHNANRFLVERLNGLFPEPSASLAAGILLGARTNIPKEVTDDFRRAGLTHILALSGYNIVILINFLSVILSIFPRRFADAFLILSIVIFTLLVGASASIVRAAIMGSLGVVARMSGRKTSGLRALFITGFIMVMIDPFIAVYDIGFQLSFGATAGLMLFSEKFGQYLKFLPEKFGIRSSLATTNAAQVFTLPLIIFYFSGFSIAAPVANIIVLPFIPFLMLGSFLSLFLGKILAAPTWLLFKTALYAVHFFASLPFAFIETGIS